MDVGTSVNILNFQTNLKLAEIDEICYQDTTSLIKPGQHYLLTVAEGLTISIRDWKHSTDRKGFEHTYFKYCSHGLSINGFYDNSKISTASAA